MNSIRVKVEVIGDVPPDKFAKSGWIPEESTSVRRNCFPDYKYMEGLLQWYFGNAVELSYRFQPDSPEPFPLVLVNGEEVARGKIPARQVVGHLEGIGLKRLDQDD